MTDIWTAMQLIKNNEEHFKEGGWGTLDRTFSRDWLPPPLIFGTRHCLKKKRMNRANVILYLTVSALIEGILGPLSVNWCQGRMAFCGAVYNMKDCNFHGRFSVMVLITLVINGSIQTCMPLEQKQFNMWYLIFICCYKLKNKILQRS